MSREVGDDSVHSTVAGLKTAEELGKSGVMRSNRSFEKLRGSLRKSLPRIGLSKESLRSGGRSAGSLSSNGTDATLQLGQGPHRSFSRPEGREGNASMHSHQHDHGALIYGVGQAMGQKDQDRFDVRLGGEIESDIHYFAVFDGHGTSALAADLCVSSLYDEVAAADRRDRDEEDDISDVSITEMMNNSHHHEPMQMPADESIVHAYNKIDAAVKASKHSEPRAGTCCVTLMVDAEPPENLIDADERGDELNVKVSWLGDCRCMMVSERGEVDALTLDHRVGVNEAERERIENSAHVPREGLLESDFWKRELDRAKKTGEKPRPHSYIGRRQQNGQYVGPECVFAHTGGVSLQVTRSIGDAYAARSVIAEPDVVSFSISRREYCRFVLGSDGIFEVMDEQEIAKFTAKISSPAKAAAKLAAHAKQKRLYSGQTPDDITVIIVDLNPELRKNFKPSSISKGTKGRFGSKK